MTYWTNLRTACIGALPTISDLSLAVNRSGRSQYLNLDTKADKMREALCVVGAIETHSENDERGVCSFERFGKQYLEGVKAKHTSESTLEIPSTQREAERGESAFSLKLPDSFTAV